MFSNPSGLLCQLGCWPPWSFSSVHCLCADQSKTQMWFGDGQTFGSGAAGTTCTSDKHDVFKTRWVYCASACTQGLRLPRNVRLVKHAKKWKPQLVSGKKYCEVTQQCMESPHRWQEKLVTSDKSRGYSWTGGRTEGSMLISLQVTCAGWTCYSLSRNVIINSETGCSSLATVLHKSELRCGPLATEINKWLNVSGTKQVMEMLYPELLGY